MERIALPLRMIAVFLLAALSVAPLGAQKRAAIRTPDVPYEPSTPEIVAAMLDLAEVKKGDIVYDLGCGDGRVVIAAARKVGARGVGIDIDPQRIREARNNARRAGVTGRVQFRNEDLFEANIRPATVVMLYLWPEVNLKLLPKLLKDLKPGTRVVSHSHDMGDWEPEKETEAGGDKIYFWTIPPDGKVPVPPKRVPDVRYEPSDSEVVAAMLKLADVKKDDVVYDLGCGDGRIVIAAAREYGTRGVGIDIDPQRIRESRENAAKAGVAGLVRFRNEDLFAADIREATVVMLYLWPGVNLRLRPKLLRDLKPGTRVVSHSHHMGEWKPEKEIRVGRDRIYCWTIPATPPDFQ